MNDMYSCPQIPSYKPFRQQRIQSISLAVTRRSTLEVETSSIRGSAPNPASSASRFG